MLRDFFIPDKFETPPTREHQRDGVGYESADLSAAWLSRFAQKFCRPAIGFEKASNTWRQRAVAAWSQVAQEFQSLQFPEAGALLDALEMMTGLSRQMLGEGLRNHFYHLHEEELRDWLRGVREDRGPRQLSLAKPYPELIFLITAGNIPGVAIHPVVQLSLLGIPTVIKNASAEPILLPAILDSLARHDPHIASRIAALTWSREAAELTGALLAFNPQLVVFGDDDTVTHFETHSRELAGFGDRFSLALVSPSAVRPEQWQGLAYDVCMYEQMGCLSPQAILLLTDDWEAVEGFCSALAEAMAKMSERLPVGRRTPAQHAAVQQWRGALAARRAAGEKIILLNSGGTEWTVAAAEHFDLSERVAYRFARVWPISSLPKAMSILHRFEMQLQSLATSLTLEETKIFIPQFAGIDSPFMHILMTAPGFMQKPIFGWMDNDAAWFDVTRALIEC